MIGTNHSRALVACSAVLVACANQADVDGSQQAIVYGDMADHSQLYGTVGVGDADYGYVFCSGTLIAADLVLTAAHCVVGVQEDGTLGEPSAAETLMVRTGATSSFAEDAVDFEVSEVIVHELYHQVPAYGQIHDVALLVLATEVPAEIQASVDILPLEEFEANLTEGADTLLAGYGTTDPTGATYGGVLYQATAPFMGGHGSEFIAGETGTADTCYGDSGGPVYVFVNGRAQVIGVTSRGATAAYECGHGGVYGSASHHIDWITEASGGRYQPWLDEEEATDEEAGEDREDQLEPLEAYSTAYCTTGAVDGSTQLPWILALLVLVARRWRP